MAPAPSLMPPASASAASSHGKQSHDCPLDQIVHALGVREGACADAEILLQAEGDDQLSVREEPDLAPLPRRACASPLPERRGALHRVQAVRGGGPGGGDPRSE